MSKTVYPQNETNISHDHHHLLCWKSTVAGLLIALMAFLMLTALGAGVVGYTAEGLVNREQGGSALASGAGLYMGLSVVIALFCGSYFALRISRFVTAKVGAAHGFVIASLFFMILLFGAGSAIGGVVSGFASLAKGAADQTANVGSNPMIQDTVNKALGTTKLKGDPKDVAQGLTIRLLQGDVDSAKSYLAYQTDMSQADIDAKATQLKADFDAAMKKAAEKTAHAVSDASLVLFVLFLVGLIGALVGGRVGAHSNVDRPLAQVSAVGYAPTLANQRGNMLPYVFGWLLGVPVSILILIAMLRTIF